MEHEKRGRHIPNHLRKYRKMAGYKQTEVAKLLGLKSTNRLSRWEHGLSMPSVKNLLLLSILYCTLPNQLYSELAAQLKQQISAQ